MLMKKMELEAKKESQTSRVDPKIHEVFEILVEISQERFWGDVTIKFRDGKPVVMSKNQQIKIED